GMDHGDAAIVGRRRQGAVPVPEPVALQRLADAAELELERADGDRRVDVEKQRAEMESRIELGPDLRPNVNAWSELPSGERAQLAVEAGELVLPGPDLEPMRAACRRRLRIDELDDHHRAPFLEAGDLADDPE